MAVSKYTTILHLLRWLSARNMSNCLIDRALADIGDADVVEAIEDIITAASDDFDGDLRGHLTVPITPTVTALTGVFSFTEGSTAVTIVGGAATTELSKGDQIRPDDADDTRVIVASVTNDTNIVLEHVYYTEDLSGGASLYVNNVPTEVEILVRGHAAYMIWARRREDDVNPKLDKEKKYDKRIEQLQTGRYKIESLVDGQISDKPIVTSDDNERDEDGDWTFTDDSMADYFP